jgi:hypothetical protein
MADVNGSNTELAANNAVAEPGCRNSRKRVLCDEYTFPADAFALNSRIKIGTLPKGARPLSAFVHSPSLGTVGIFDLGTDDDQNGYVDQADAGGQAVHKAGTGVLLDGRRLAEAVDVYLHCTEATDSAEGDVISAAVEYSLD